MDEETREIILLFIRAFKRCQVRALSLDSAITAIVEMSPADRATLTPDRVRAEIANVRNPAEMIVAQQTARLEQAFRDDKRALSTLQVFASSHLRRISLNAQALGIFRTKPNAVDGTRFIHCRHSVSNPLACRRPASRIGHDKSA
jgi:hypothetical protein